MSTDRYPRNCVGRRLVRRDRDAGHPSPYPRSQCALRHRETIRALVRSLTPAGCAVAARKDRYKSCPTSQRIAAAGPIQRASRAASDRASAWHLLHPATRILCSALSTLEWATRIPRATRKSTPTLVLTCAFWRWPSSVPACRMRVSSNLHAWRSGSHRCVP